MSKPFRGISQPQMTHLRPDIVLIEYSDSGAEADSHFDQYVCSAEYRADATGRHECFISIPFCAAVV